MASVNNFLKVMGLSIVLILLIVGLFGWIRYEQVSTRAELDKQDLDMAKKEYIWKLSTDAQSMYEKVEEVKKLLMEKENLRESTEFQKALKGTKFECDWSLKGLAGRVDSVVCYEKDLRQPVGTSLEKHQAYQEILEELKLLLKELGEKGSLTLKEREDFIERLSMLTSELERWIASL